MDSDLQVRLAAFNWLSEQVNSHGDVLLRKLLEKGFEFQGQRIPLVAPQGIFKPQVLDLPLSITTAPKGPYDDYFGKDNFLIYSYRGTDPNHRDNVGLRKVFELKRPLVYFHGIEPGKYLATYPVTSSGMTQSISLSKLLSMMRYPPLNTPKPALPAKWQKSPMRGMLI